MDIHNLVHARNPVKNGVIRCRPAVAWASLLLMLFVTPSFAADEAIKAEAQDVANAIGKLDQSYLYRGLRSGHHSARVEGSSFGDRKDAPSSNGTQQGSRVQAMPDQADQTEVVRNAVSAEAQDVADAIGQLDQSYAISGQRSGHSTAHTEGSAFGDAGD